MSNLTLELLFERDRGRCSYCGMEVRRGSCLFGKSTVGLACVDHVIPRSKGGDGQRRQPSPCVP